LSIFHTVEALDSISMQPNLMKTEQIDEDEDEEMSFLAVDDEDDTYFVKVCGAQTSELDRNLL
jgi:hypothetical protein